MLSSAALTAGSIGIGAFVALRQAFHSNYGRASPAVWTGTAMLVPVLGLLLGGAAAAGSTLGFWTAFVTVIMITSVVESLYFVFSPWFRGAGLALLAVPAVFACVFAVACLTGWLDGAGAFRAAREVCRVAAGIVLTLFS